MSVKSIVLVSLLCSFVSLVAFSGETTNLSHYIGSTYPPLPKEIKKESGIVIGDPIQNIMYSVAWISKGQEQMLWFSNAKSDVKNADIVWTVLDAIPVLKYKHGETLVIGLCSINNEPDPEILALVKYAEDQEFFRNIVKAWRANRVTKSFETIKPNGISCANESYDE